MTKNTRNWLIAISIVAFPFVLFLGFLIFLEEPLPPLAPLPNPNGYQDLVKAGKMVKGDVSHYDKADVKMLRGTVLTNAEALALARSAMSNQCGVPLQFTQGYITNHVQDLIAFRSLAQALVCEGKFAEKEKRFKDAADSYLDAMRLGNQVTRGGILLDEMLGAAINTLGDTQLGSVITNLNASVCRYAAGCLETLDSQRQTWDDLMRQENAWSHGTYRTFPGWRYDIIEWKGIINRWKNRKTIASVITTTKQTFDNQEQKTRQLIIALAARAYELDKGHPPASITDLVPDYLKAVPQDPVTGANLGLQ